MKEYLLLAMLFIGMAIGSSSPLGIWGLIAFMILGTIFMIFDLTEERKESVGR